MFLTGHCITKCIPIQKNLEYSNSKCSVSHQIHGFVRFELIFVLDFVFHLGWETGKSVT